MTTLRFTSGTVARAFAGRGARIWQADPITGIDMAVSPDRTLVLHRRETTVICSAEGRPIPRGTWPENSVIAVPSGIPFSVKFEPPGALAIVRIENDLFERAIREYGNYVSIEGAFAEVKSDVVPMLIRHMVDMAEGGLLDRYPRLSESMTIALSVEAAAGLMPDLREHVEHARGGLTPERRKRVVDYVADHLHEPLPIGVLADVAGMSPYHFSRIFTQTFGVSPARYVMTRRVERAKRLILDGSEMADAALASGFASQSHMSMVFKRIAGLTPSEFRRARLVR